MSGTPAHEKLRAAWGVPAGGFRRVGRPPQDSRDIIGNLLVAGSRRITARRRELEVIADAVYADKVAGMSDNAIKAKYKCNVYSLHPIWRERGYTYAARVVRT